MDEINGERRVFLADYHIVGIYRGNPLIRVRGWAIEGVGHPELQWQDDDAASDGRAHQQLAPFGLLPIQRFPPIKSKEDAIADEAVEIAIPETMSLIGKDD